VFTETAAAAEAEAITDLVELDALPVAD